MVSRRHLLPGILGVVLVCAALRIRDPAATAPVRRATERRGIAPAPEPRFAPNRTVPSPRTDDVARLAGRVESAEVEAGIVATLQTTRDREVARQAVRALAGRRSAVPALQHVLSAHPSPGIRAEAALALAGAGSLGRDALERSIETEGDRQVHAIIRDSIRSAQP